jgi:glucose-1-phosphate adenylyltransferase
MNTSTIATPGNAASNTAWTHSTYAVVLAGGRGSRLHALTDWRAKPAVPFAGMLNIIDFPLSNCVNSGIRRIGVFTQYKAQSLIRHIERAWGFLDANLGEYVESVPAQQRAGEAWYSGTANAVYQNLDIVREGTPEFVLVLAGDHVYKMDYGLLLADHVAKRADVTVACLEVPLADASRFGVMAVDADERITCFEEKPAHPATLCGHTDRALASMGIYVFGTEFLCEQLARDAQQAHSGHDFGADLIPDLVPRCRVYAHHFESSCVRTGGGPAYWRDVGTLDAYWEANMDLTRVVPQLDLYDDAWPIRSRQRHLPPAKFVFDHDSRRGVALDSLVCSGCIVSGAVVRRSILFVKVRVGEDSVVEDSLLLPGVVVGRGVHLRRAIIDKNCILPDGLRVGFDPQADGTRFHVTPMGVTLVTPEMLGQHVHLGPGTATDAAHFPESVM